MRRSVHAVRALCTGGGGGAEVPVPSDALRHSLRSVPAEVQARAACLLEFLCAPDS